MLDVSFEYNRDASPDIRPAGIGKKDGVEIRDFTYLTPDDVRRAASVVRPDGVGPFPGILYLHWYEPESGTSDRRQFTEEAVEMAQRGVLCMLTETLWSDRDWFIKRTQMEDFDASVRQVIALRRALDLLLAEPGVDPMRVALVGHDFGGMYGIVLGSVDQRLSHYVIMAATGRFPDWFLYYPRLEGAERDAFIEAMRSLDPVAHVSRLAPAPILFQFATEDPHVPVERARLLFDAAGEPKELRWYDAGHALNEAAARDRIAWLSETMALRSPETS